jgi:hypothetical protein
VGGLESVWARFTSTEQHNGGDSAYHMYIQDRCQSFLTPDLRDEKVVTVPCIASACSVTSR